MGLWDILDGLGKIAGETVKYSGVYLTLQSWVEESDTSHLRYLIRDALRGLSRDEVRAYLRTLDTIKQQASAAGKYKVCQKIVVVREIIIEEAERERDRK